MLLLLRDMDDAQRSFNARVLALRDRKRNLVSQLGVLHSHIAEVDRCLGGSGAHLAAITVTNLQGATSYIAVGAVGQHQVYAGKRTPASLFCCAGSVVSVVLPALPHMQPLEEPEARLLDVNESDVTRYLNYSTCRQETSGKDCATTSMAATMCGNRSMATSGQMRKFKHEERFKQDQAVSDFCDDSAHRSPHHMQSLADVQALQAQRKQLLAELQTLQTGFDAAIAICHADGLRLALKLKTMEGQLLHQSCELRVLEVRAATFISLCCCSQW
jgi:hypothetical protein